MFYNAHFKCFQCMRTGQVVLLLTACKLAYPNHFHINRGNHETLEVNALYGFKGEMCNKYNEKLYAIFNEVIRSLIL